MPNGDAAGDTAEAPADATTPEVGVVLATHNRPELMRRALRSILAQNYAGRIRVVVVFDRSPPDMRLEQDEDGRIVSVCENTRTPGLAGARNTGIESLDTPLVAFCDDDDYWTPHKLSRQVVTLQKSGAEFASTAMLVEYGDHRSQRLAESTSIRYADLLRSRMAMVHSSSFLMRRAALVDGIGLVDESIPESMCEDWDLLLRAAKRHPIAHLDEPLTVVQWGESYFNERWSVKNTAHQWMLVHHPDILSSRVGAGRVFGQLAFGYAALGNRRESMRWAARAMRSHLLEPRAVLALLVVMRIVSDETVMRALQKRGHGI